MSPRSSTADLIVEAARRHFNEKGYAAATLTEIAASVNISQGNLTYHFPTKRDLVTRLQQEVASRVADHRSGNRPDAIEDDFLDHLRFTTHLMATYRFLLRDDAQIEPGPDHHRPHLVLVNGYAALRERMQRVEAAGLFRTDIELDIDALTRSLWIVGRYWMDHLNEMELRDEISSEDQDRGVAHHMAVLIPNLTAAGRRRFEAACARPTQEVAEAGR